MQNFLIWFLSMHRVEHLNNFIQRWKGIRISKLVITPTYCLRDFLMCMKRDLFIVLQNQPSNILIFLSKNPSELVKISLKLVDFRSAKRAGETSFGFVDPSSGHNIKEQYSIVFRNLQRSVSMRQRRKSSYFDAQCFRCSCGLIMVFMLDFWQI